MRKKTIAALAAVSVLCLGGAAMAGCGKTETIVTPHTEHVLEHIEGKKATCIAEGWIEHDRCIYCGKTFVDDVETDIVLPVDPNGHELTHHDEIYGCTVDGLAAYDECNLCEKILVDGQEVSLNDLVLKATNTHTWDSSGLVCQYGDAYKLLYNGEYYVIDGLNLAEFTPCAEGAYSSTTNAEQKKVYFDSLFANRMTFFTQTGSGASVTGSGDSWVISNTNAAKTIGNFTRFAYGNGSEGYVGRFLVAFDVAVSAEVSADRFGIKIVDNTATAITAESGAWSNVSKLIGANASEENNADRIFKPGQTYRFVYELETTESEQMVQIFTCLTGAATVTVSNLHCVPLEEKTGVVDYKLIYFGDPDGVVVDKAECAHEWAYTVPAKDASCDGGWVEYVHCPRCGTNTIDGVEVGDDEIYLDPVHNTEGAAWQSDGEHHWKVCVDCGAVVELADHVSSGAATEEQAEVCTVCGYLITPMVGHTHNMQYTAAQETATCTEAAHVAYYYCADCGKYFADEEGLQELNASEIVTQEALGHEMGERVEAKDATCTEAGNVAYYYCSRCEKYFADAEGTEEITDVVIPATGHSIQHYERQEATCYQDANIEYYYCSICGKYFSDAEGENEITKEDVFTPSTIEHNLNADGECVNEGCPVKKTDVTFKTNDNSNGKTAAVVNPTLLANPGTWAVQTSSGNNATFADDKITVTLPYNKADKKNTGFMRTVPSKDGKTAFTGKFILHFDVTLISVLDSGNAAIDGATTGNLMVGYFIQDVSGSSVMTIADSTQTFEVGVTYHFAVTAELTDGEHYVQFNLRQTAGMGAVVEITNPQIIYYAEKDNADEFVLESLIFMQKQTSADVAVPEALLPDNKSEYGE